MKNISVHIKKGEKTTFTFKKPIATYGTRIAAKEVTVFWNFKNITSTIGNHTFTITNSSNVLSRKFANPAPTLWRVDPTRHPRTKCCQREG